MSYVDTTMDVISALQVKLLPNESDDKPNSVTYGHYGLHASEMHVLAVDWPDIKNNSLYIPHFISLYGIQW